MTRTEAIAIITEKLSSLDDERVMTVADIVQDMAKTDDLPRHLTPRELALIEQSKEDFKAGRAYSLAEARAMTDAFLPPLACQSRRHERRSPLQDVHRAIEHLPRPGRRSVRRSPRRPEARSVLGRVARSERFSF